MSREHLSYALLMLLFLSMLLLPVVTPPTSAPISAAAH